MPQLNQTGGRWLRLAALGSQLINVLLFNGSPDETVSGRAYRQGVLMQHAGWARARRVIDRVFWWDGEHCYKSHMQDVRMAEAITALYR